MPDDFPLNGRRTVLVVFGGYLVHRRLSVRLDIREAANPIFQFDGLYGEDEKL